MILVISLSPAIDVTYTVGELTIGEVNRVTHVERRPGGKGLNVARILGQLGQDPNVLIPLGGPNGVWIQEQCKALELDCLNVPITQNTRQALTIFNGVATTVNEPASELSDAEQEQIKIRLETLLESTTLVIFNGSVPLGLRAGFVGELVSQVTGRNIKMIVDVSGPALLEACKHGPFLVKPNQHELFESTGHEDLERGVRDLQELGARNVLVSRGDGGASLFLEDGLVLHEELGKVLSGNPTGAGDAMVAAVARGIELQASWIDLLREGVAAGGAAVLSPVAGEIELQDFENFIEQMKESNELG